MAFVNPIDDEEEQKRLAAEGGQPQLAGEQGGLEGGGAMSGYTSPNKTGTSGFVDVHAYLDANRDQAQDNANKIGAKVGEQVEATRGKVKTAEDAFNDRLEKGTTKKNTGLVDTALTDPAGFVKDPNNVSSFKSLRDAIYGGPKSLEEINEFSPANAAVKEGKRIAAGVNNPQGRDELLYRVSKRPTAGNIALDSLLIGGDQGARKSLEDSTKPFGEIDTYLQGASTTAKEKAAAGEKETLDARNYAQSRLDAETNKFQTDLDARLGTARTEAQKNADYLKAGIENSAGLTDQELEAAGMNRAQWDELIKTKGLLETDKPFSDTQANYGQKFNLGDFYNQANPDTEITRENFASGDDYARERALQTLADNGQFDALPDDASMAGKASKNLGRFSSGEATTQSQAKLRALDDQFLDQYKDFNLGEHKAPEWVELLKDPFQAQSYQRMIDIVNRNPEKANALQKGVAAQLQTWIDANNTLGGGGGDAFDPNEGGGGTNNLRTIDGERQWWDGSAWVKPPSETKREGGKTYQFNYNTGEYEETAGTGVIGIGGPGTNQWGAY